MNPGIGPLKGNHKGRMGVIPSFPTYGTSKFSGIGCLRQHRVGGVGIAPLSKLLSKWKQLELFLTIIFLLRPFLRLRRAGELFFHRSGLRIDEL